MSGARWSGIPVRGSASGAGSWFSVVAAGISGPAMMLLWHNKHGLGASWAGTVADSLWAVSSVHPSTQIMRSVA